MIRNVALVMALSLAPQLAGPAGAADTLQQAAAASERDLEASLRELTALREGIASERLPLTKELSALEERLARLRREHDEALRRRDGGTVDASAVQGETKLRQDEIAYVGNLLDEYARGFEGRLDASERARYGEAVERAKDAPTNNALTPDERFGRQIALVEASVARLDDVIGGTRFPGSAVDARGVVTDGRFALVGPVALFASTDGAVSGVAVAQTGSKQPAVRPLGDDATPGLASVVTLGAGILPLDPTRGAALQELVQRASLIHIFKKGGPIMWPLLAVSILALGTVIERVLFLMGERKRRDEPALQEFLRAVERDDIERAVRLADASGYFVVRALGYALSHRERSLASALLYAQARELKRFTRGVPILDTAITISPLLGLLGTVTGMMHSFSLIGGELSAPGAITGGIAEALIATAFGLGIAILALLPFNYLNNRVEEARHELEAAATQLELVAQHPALPASPGPAPAAAHSGHGVTPATLHRGAASVAVFAGPTAAQE